MRKASARTLSSLNELLGWGTLVVERTERTPASTKERIISAGNSA
jgi:hypothetical protein